MENNKKSNKKNKKKSKKTSQNNNNNQTATAAEAASTINNEELSNNGEDTSATNEVEEATVNENKIVEVQQTQVVAAPSQTVANRVAGGAPAVPPPSQSTNSNFDNLQKAVETLGKAKQLDEAKQFENALKLYRQGVDLLLEELIDRQGTEQSRSYLRDKCNDFMNRIDQIKLIIKIENETANKENSQ